MDDVSLLLLFAVAIVPLLPTEIALVSMGVAAANGGDPLVLVVGVAAAGCLLSDVLLYAVGQRTGARLLARARGRASVDTSVRWLERHLERRGAPTLVLARWLPAGGTVGALLAGSVRWSRPRFLAASVIGVLAWCSYVGVLGYMGGELLSSEYGTVFSVLVALLAATGTAILFRRTLSVSTRA